ncbi:MAG: class I fructose-bisphosphate aldolase [Candidatus Daviesbacteria bacterium]|nr:class I fructose-bisphosphate aldolase [Candidatus Daviesbacteria bacterium]
MDQVKDTISQLLVSPKGLLAADESTKTIQKRFDTLGIECNEQSRLAYRKMLFSTPGVEEFLSGVILYDETIRQNIDGVPIPKYLENRGIVPGIKVDRGTEQMGSTNELVTKGLEGLEERLIEYKQMGAKFTKWRMVVKIGEGMPTEECLKENIRRLAQYAKIAQSMDLVPIIEPEVVRDGRHDLKKCQEITTKMLKKVFEKMSEAEIALDRLILKTNMVTAGGDNPSQANPEEVAQSTVESLMESVPKEVPGIVFLSGGQSPDMATQNLNAIVKIGPPSGGWTLSFSFARALQDEPLMEWGGKEENVGAAQKVFLERLKKVALAREGKL